jgi:hypothetical protein
MLLQANEGTIPLLGTTQLRNSGLVSLVPPLRGLLFYATTAPPLPQWAMIFRPWRDWKAVGSIGMLHDDMVFRRPVAPKLQLASLDPGIFFRGRLNPRL